MRSGWVVFVYVCPHVISGGGGLKGASKGERCYVFTVKDYRHLVRPDVFGDLYGYVSLSLVVVIVIESHYIYRVLCVW